MTNSVEADHHSLGARGAVIVLALTLAALLAFMVLNPGRAEKDRAPTAAQGNQTGLKAGPG